MLKVTIPESELWNSSTKEFVHTKAQTIVLEHSLVSISRWESHWHIPFFSKTPKTTIQTIDYIRCMTITKGVDKNIFFSIPKSVEKQIKEYIENPMSGTTISSFGGDNKSKTVYSSEIIYYMMFSRGIPIECERWHLNRLLMLIRVFDYYNSSSSHGKGSSNGKTGLSSAERARINAQRRKAMNSSG